MKGAVTWVKATAPSARVLAGKEFPSPSGRHRRGVKATLETSHTTHTVVVETDPSLTDSSPPTDHCSGPSEPGIAKPRELGPDSKNNPRL
jgi:hypothetical protein